MERKQWLETFLELVVKGAPMLEYRKRLRLKAPAVAKHLKNIGTYQRELEDLKEAEERENDRARRKKEEKHKALQERARKAREAKARKRERSRRDETDSIERSSSERVSFNTASSRYARSEGSSPSDDVEADAGGDSEAVGPREDNSED